MTTTDVTAQIENAFPSKEADPFERLVENAAPPVRDENYVRLIPSWNIRTESEEYLERLERRLKQAREKRQNAKEIYIPDPMMDHGDVQYKAEFTGDDFSPDKAFLSESVADPHEEERPLLEHSDHEASSSAAPRDVPEDRSGCCGCICC